MAVRIIDGGIVIRASLDSSELKREAKNMVKDLEGLTNVNVTPDKQSQLKFIESLRQARLEAAKSKAEYESLSAQYVKGEIGAQQYRLEVAKLNQQRKEEARQAREVKKALLENSSYRKLDNELKTLRATSKDLLAEMVRLERQGLKNSEAYRQLARESNNLVGKTMTLDRQMKSIDAAVGQNYRNVGNYGDAISMVAPQLSQFTGRLGLLGLAVAGVNQSFNSNLRMEPITQSLKFASGSATEFQKNLDFLRESSDRLGLEFISTATSFKLWQGAAKFSNLTATESRGIFESVANASAKMKLSNEQVQGTFLALSQIMSKGKVQAEELRGQLGERLPGAFSLAAKAMGVTEVELNKMLEKGEVLASDFLPRFAAQLDISFGNDKTERIEGMQASVNRLKNEFDALWQSERAGKFFFAISDGLATLTSNFNKFINSGSVREFFLRFAGVFSSSPLQQGVSRMFGDAQQAIDKAGGNGERGLVSYKEMADFYKLSKDKQKDAIKAQETIVSLQTEEYKKNKENLKIRESMLWNAEKLAKMRSKVGSDPVLNPITKGDSSKDKNGKKAAERAAERERQSLERQRSLQAQIDDLAEKATRKQISRDEEEIASISDKYDKIRVEVEKFYRDPKNKGQRVDVGKLASAERFEKSEAKTRQETRDLLKDLSDQKALYDEFNSYVAENGIEAAEKMFGKQADLAKDYRSNLKKEYTAITTLQSTASALSFSGVDIKLTQAQEERAKALKAMLDAIDKEDEAKAKSKYAEALKMAETFNDKRIKIEKQYQESLKALGGGITPEQKAALDNSKNTQISEAAKSELMGTEAWNGLFYNLDELTANQLNKLIDEIEKKFDTLKLSFNPIDIQAVRKKLNEARDLVIKDNPFKQLGVALKAVFEDADEQSKDGANNIKRNWTNLAKSTKASFDFVSDAINSADFLKEAIGEVGQTALMSMMAVATTAIAVSTAIKTAEKASVILAIVQAALVVVNAIAGLFKSIFAAGDKRLEKSIQSKKVSVEELDRAFQNLQRSMERVAGEDYYKIGEAQIRNLERQREITKQMISEEEKKKKADKNKIQDYKNEVEDIGNKIEDVTQSINEKLVQTTFQDFSDEVTDAFIAMYEGGEDALDKLDKTFDQFIKNALANSLKMKFIEPIVKEMIDGLAIYMKSNNNSLMGFDFQSWRDKISEAGQQVFDVLDTAYDGLNLNKNNSSSSLGSESNGIQRLTEETGNEIVGMYRSGYDILKQHLSQLKVMSKNQMDCIGIANSQLAQLNSINVNTAATVTELQRAVSHLNNIDKSVSKRYV